MLKSWITMNTPALGFLGNIEAVVARLIEAFLRAWDRVPSPDVRKLEWLLPRGSRLCTMLKG